MAARDYFTAELSESPRRPTGAGDREGEPGGGGGRLSHREAKSVLRVLPAPS